MITERAHYPNRLFFCRRPFDRRNIWVCWKAPDLCNQSFFHNIYHVSDRNEIN